MKKLTPEWALRIGLALMYLYSGWDIFIRPTSWHWAVPYWFSKIVTQFVSIDTYLRFQGISEAVLGIFLILWFLRPKFLQWAALFLSLEMAAILAFSGIDAITFRDIGLLGGLIALWLIFNEKVSANSQ